MPDATVSEQFERRLVELGCPGPRLKASVQELGEHYQDLKEAALAEGRPEKEAEARAAVQLGHPVVLAENLVMGLRQASWWGRHPILGFCLCPPFLLVFIWFGCLGGLIGLSRFWGWALGPAYALDQSCFSAFQSDSAAFNALAGPLVLGLNTTAIVVLTLGFCWLAWRSALGWKWVVTTCAACFVAGLCGYFSLQPHNLSFGLTWHQPHWPLVAIPGAMAVLSFWRQRTMENRLPAILFTATRAPSPNSSIRARVGDGLVTPTYWVTAILVALMSWAVSQHLAQVRQAAAHRTELEHYVWPAERAAILAQLKTRQQADAGRHETTIDLKPWLNMDLDADTGSPVRMQGNNLASFPGGVHYFAGVPFEVAGRAQLFGRTMTNVSKLFPERIRNIIIGSRCDRLQLLHGACDMRRRGETVARLVLHYADGSTAELPVIAGEHLLDWWGPIYNTHTDSGRYTTDPGTELAWAGSNPALHKQAPDFSLRLYRSTFANPHPELEISTLDYVSTLTQAAPFMVGLTVETLAP